MYTSWIGTPSLNTRSSSTRAKSCGTAGAYVVADERDLGPLLQLGHEPLRVLPEVVDGLAGAILDEHVDAAGLADAGDGGRQEREHLRLGQPIELPIHGGDDRVRLEPPRRPLVVGRELDEVQAVARARRLRQEAVPGDRVDVVDARLGLQDLVDLRA